MQFSPLLLLASAAGSYAAVLTPRATCSDGTVTANAACCRFVPIRNMLISDIFEGVCGENAHSTVRIAFHDAIGFSNSGGKGNGADGSIIKFQDTELTFAANKGIDDIVGDLQPFADANGISYGDVIHFGSSVALSLCPGAPIVQTFIGRGNASVAAPDGTVPDPFDPVTTILARFADAGFQPAEVISLLASHSIAAQDEVDPSVHGSPFDSTPGQFDSQVFLEVMLRGTTFPGKDGANQGEVEAPLPGEFRLQSDSNLARDSRTACTWQSLALNQKMMASSFATAMAKLSLLGQSKSALTDCTDIIPAAPPAQMTKAFFPAGTNHGQIEQACASQAFPTTLSTAAGGTTSVAPVPTQ